MKEDSKLFSYSTLLLWVYDSIIKTLTPNQSSEKIFQYLAAIPAAGRSDLQTLAVWHAPVCRIGAGIGKTAFHCFRQLSARAHPSWPEMQYQNVQPGHHASF
ncbi:MAG: hypothetical protein J5855_09440 [Mailhella sp.]|nr:hypothetical protein [Mailhella sp.]